MSSANPSPLIDRRDVAAVILIPLVTFVAFAPTLVAQFSTWDDPDTVARNPLLLPPAGGALVAFWTRPHGHLYIPVTYTAWWGVAHVAYGNSELSAKWFHALNLIVHVAAAMLAYHVLKRLVRSEKAALCGALLLAIHPVQVEAVAWVSGFKDVLFGTLSLAAIYAYLKFADGERPRSNYVVATGFFVLAMLAKPTAMVLPLVATVLDVVMLRRPMKSALRATWPWFVLAIPCAIAAKAFQPPLETSDAVALWGRPLVALDAIAFYLYKLLRPTTLTFDYGRTPAYVFATRAVTWTWVVPVAAALFAGWAWRRRGVREVAAGLAVMAIVLLPVLGLVPFDFQTYSTVADHYLYLAMLGPALIVASLVARRPTKETFTVAACALALLGMRTFAQTRHWHDSTALFTHGIDANPRSFASYNSLAALAVEKNDTERAAKLARKSIGIRPTANAYSTLGEALRRNGDLAGAESAWREAIRRDERFSPALSNLAILLAEQRRFDEAVVLARRAVDADPHSLPARVNLALMYLDTGKPELARPQLDAALRLDPSNEAVRAHLQQMP